MSKKGVSAEEKRNRMLQLFYEKKSFFQLKELEKIAPKEKGVIANSVKEVIQHLVDDGLVDTDKIGASIYFWAFPSKATNIRKRKLDELKVNYEKSTKKLKEVTEAVDKSKIGKENTSQMNLLLDSNVDLQIERDELLKKLNKYRDNDPDVLKNISKETEEIKNAANRWTDNILSIKDWCKKKFMIENNVLDKQFGIPDNFDYIQ